MVTKNAENNPFRVDKFETLKWVPFPETLDEIYGQWQDAEFRGQLIGPHGSGKTSLAHKLEGIANKNGLKSLYLFANSSSLKVDFREWRSQLLETDSETLVIFDGIGHSPYWLRRSLLRQTHKFLALVHKPLKNIQPICDLNPQPDLLEKLCMDLAPDEGLALLNECGDSAELLRKHKNNLRDCFFELYDLWGK